MAYEEWNREIPIEEQVREVSKILAVALLRRHRGIPPAFSTCDTPRVPLQPAPASPHKPPPPDEADQPAFACRPHRRSKRMLFWLERVRSLERVSPKKLNAAVCGIDSGQACVDLADAFDFAMSQLSDEQRRVAVLVSLGGMAHAARELGCSQRQITNVLARMRRVFVRAGLGHR